MNIILIGAGPRNLVLTARLIAHAKEQRHPTTIHLVDPEPLGGRVWEPTQNPHFIANTVAQQLTLFTDATIDTTAPQQTGPDFYTWTQTAAKDWLATQHYQHHDAFIADIATMTPNTFPSRALFGVYADWYFDQITANLPEGVQVNYHQTKAIDVQSDASGHLITLENGIQLQADQLVLTPGHLPVNLTVEETAFQQAAENHDTWSYLAPMHPSKADFSAIPAQAHVLVRGIGLSFFDYVTALTVGRGGHFQREAGQLTYVASGQEPKIVAGSRSGLPPHARGLNQKVSAETNRAQFLTTERLAELADPTTGHVAFDAFFHLVYQELGYTYYHTLVSDPSVTWPFEIPEFLQALADSERIADVVNDYPIPVAQQLDWDFVTGKDVATPDGLYDYLQQDFNGARLGNVSGPYAAMFDLLKDLRGKIRHFLADGIFDDANYAQFLHQFNPLDHHLSVGPPALRIEQLLALMQAGIVTLTGPQLKATTTDQGYHAQDELGHSWSAQHLVEARLPRVDLNATTDPFFRRLLDEHQLSTGQLCDGTRLGARHEHVTLHALNNDGQPVDHLFIWGVPTEGWVWFTTYAPRPNVGDRNLQDAEIIAQTIFN